MRTCAHIRNCCLLLQQPAAHNTHHDHRMATLFLHVIHGLLLLAGRHALRLPITSLQHYNRPHRSLIHSSHHTNTTTVLAAATATATASSSSDLTYLQTMLAGAVSRSMAQVLMHPANTYKTMLQLKGATAANIVKKLSWERLLRGADAQFLLSLPHGAFYFFVIDRAKAALAPLFLPLPQLAFLQDFAASTISTVCCSVVSTPQMVLTDRLMAGMYPTLPVALRNIMRTEGFAGFYAGWWPALAQKIPSYGCVIPVAAMILFLLQLFTAFLVVHRLTWMFFQQLKRLHEQVLGTAPAGETSFGLGAFASAAAVAVMIPMDTVKTRLVTQLTTDPRAYKGVRDCFLRVLNEEGVGAFYRSLPPRLMSVVPMIAIQFGAYEMLKARFVEVNREKRRAAAAKLRQRGAFEDLSLCVRVCPCACACVCSASKSPLIRPLCVSTARCDEGQNVGHGPREARAAER